MPSKLPWSILVCGALLASVTGVALAVPLPPAAPLVHGVVSDSATLTLPRDRPGALKTSYDRGALIPSAVLQHITLTLKRPANQQAAFDKLTHDQYVRGTADYHRWLAPGELRAYGPAQADIAAVVLWLTRHGLTVNSVSPSGMSIDFGGSAANVATAFHAPLHFVEQSGEAHISNITAPAIPAALAPVVTGVTLSNFFPKPALHRATPNLTVGKSGYFAVAPADFATIYNVNPLRGSFNFYNKPITGKGVTIALVEQTLISGADWNRFRQVFGLSKYTGKLTQINPGGCTAAGVTGDEVEAAIDTEWSSAVAPDANIINAACATASPLNFGVETALMNLVERGTPATIFSISYGGPELASGFAFVVGWNNLLQEGAAEGKAIFVSSGDSGSSADRNTIDANGLDINGLSDSAYNVSVGGTDFYDTALGQDATYWHQTNSPIGESAISYIPEIPWNNSCASSVVWKFYKVSGAIANCNAGSSKERLQNGVGGTGGQSDYYTKPDWQLTSVLGMPNDGVRDQPDVSLFAANGIWGHFYVICMSDAKEGGSPCDYQNQTDLFGNAYGGTSVSSPAFAGIQALVQQTYETASGQVIPLGNPAPEYYKIAQAQFTTPLGFSKCDSTLGNTISPACVFNYVTVGDNSEPCYQGSSNCATSAQSTKGIGVLGNIVVGKREFAYPAQPGYSLATGLGTVNVTNLLYNYAF